MSGGQPSASAIAMTSRQKAILVKYSNKDSIAMNLKKRIGILVLASEGRSNASVGREVGADVNTVKKWRRRWSALYEELGELEEGKSGEGSSDKSLLDRMLLELKDVPRSGTPKRISLSQEAQIVALACEKPEDYGIEMTQWNREMLAHVAMSKGIVDKISPRYVSEILKKKQASTP